MAVPSAAKVRAALIAEPGKSFKLADRDPGARPVFEDKDEARSSLEADAVEIDELQNCLYAEGKRAVLVVLQGIDTSGKSSTIRAVFSRTGPLGVNVTSFGKPSEVEREHDYLWRIHRATPRKGCIGVFDRSHYEDVLVVRVRGLAPKEAIEQRYDQINAFESHLVENGVIVLKFFLHISHEEQAERLKARLEDPHKRWKFNPADLDDRALWDQYAGAYELAIARCSTEAAPWFVVPSNSKTRRKAMVARIVRGALEEMNPQMPDPGYRRADYPIE
ncbi:MAG: polyphosphate kinase 2 family protein [Maricaulaceae bacterium]|jgi:PPK2 family polyphosphate:nucleotide phosphotransferase